MNDVEFRAELSELLGPQYDGDGPFAARMRVHQSWWRAAVLAEPCGVGPTQSSTNRYGNFLTEQAAEQGRNFLTPHIWDVVQERLEQGGGVGRYRCLYNLLSSQPMCFNLFGQLRGRNELATRLFAALLPAEVAEVTDVVIESAPSPKERYLDDATSFDAFVRYRRESDDTEAFLAIETKLTDRFSDKHYELDHTPAYREITEQHGSPWKPSVGEQITDVAWNQLWRNHRLAVALVQDSDRPFTSGIPVVVHHSDDAAGQEAINGYRNLLVDPDSIVALDLRQIVDRWRPLVDGTDREWIDVFDARYVQLELSEAAAT